MGEGVCLLATLAPASAVRHQVVFGVEGGYVNATARSVEEVGGVGLRVC